MRLRRSDVEGPGYRRIRSGRGFRYETAEGGRLSDAGELERVRALVIPPAWREVWICPDAKGHLQATGVDAAGRTQYLYHESWRDQRDKAKFDRILEFAAILPTVRDRVSADIDGHGLTRPRVLAAAVRLLDIGLFRAGGEAYAKDNGTYGLATLLREHVHARGDGIEFDYTAKSAQHRVHAVSDPEVCKVVRSLKRRKEDSPGLLGYRDGRAWHAVRSHDVNDYLREISGGDHTAKDFRTWHATVLAAIGLAVSEKAGKRGDTAAEAAVRRVVKEVAHYLGNTPAVARASYIDPRVLALYSRGRTIAAALPDLGVTPDEPASHDVEQAVLTLLTA